MKLTTKQYNKLKRLSIPAMEAEVEAKYLQMEMTGRDIHYTFLIVAQGFHENYGQVYLKAIHTDKEGKKINLSLPCDVTLLVPLI